MNKTTIVAFLLLLTSNAANANNFNSEINTIESLWAHIYYDKNESEQRSNYPKLLKKTQELEAHYPNAPELLIWQAIIIATNAAFETPFTALESLKNSKRLLQKAIQIDPNALEGAAFVTLGTLYYLAPSWPLSFGDEEKAEKLLKKGLDINPNSIDANYFYADYLLSSDNVSKATKYFNLALTAPTRPEQQFADIQLKNEAQIALQKTQQRVVESGKFKFLSLFSSAKANQSQKVIR